MSGVISAAGATDCHPSGGRFQGYGSKIDFDAATTLASAAMRPIIFTLKKKRSEIDLVNLAKWSLSVQQLQSPEVKFTSRQKENN